MLLPPLPSLHTFDREWDAGGARSSLEQLGGDSAFCGVDVDTASWTCC